MKPRDVRALLVHFGPSPDCKRCGKAATDLHHIKPKARGGSDSVFNRAPLCRSCHSWAHGHSIEAHDAGFILWSWEQEPAA